MNMNMNSSLNYLEAVIVIINLISFIPYTICSFVFPHDMIITFILVPINMTYTLTITIMTYVFVKPKYVYIAFISCYINMALVNIIISFVKLYYNEMIINSIIMLTVGITQLIYAGFFILKRINIKPKIISNIDNNPAIES